MSESRTSAGAVLERAAVMTHVAVRTTRIDDSIRFYQRYAGLHVVHERTDEGIRVAWLSHRQTDPVDGTDACGFGCAG